MKQTYLPEHFPQVKLDFDPNSLKRRVKDPDYPSKTLKTEEPAQLKPKLNIPPSRVNDLSLGTLSILNALNLQNTSRVIRSSEDVLNSVSAREKYQDLLDSDRKLPLPYKYKRLLKLQECIDTIINNASLRKIPTTFGNLKLAIENTYEITVELENIQRILYLCPELYLLHWEVTGGEENLVISFPSASTYCLSAIHNRNTMLNKELLHTTKKYHSAHLNSFPQKVLFDADVCRTWHSSFNLHNVPDIPLANLPEKNSQESPTVAKVSVAKQLRAARLMSLCKILSNIFSAHKTPSIFLKGLVKKVQAAKSKKEESKFIENDILELCEILHTWIGIIKTSSGDVVRVNKQIDFSIKSANTKIKQRYN